MARRPYLLYATTFRRAVLGCFYPIWRDLCDFPCFSWVSMGDYTVVSEEMTILSRRYGREARAPWIRQYILAILRYIPRPW